MCSISMLINRPHKLKNKQTPFKSFTYFFVDCGSQVPVSSCVWEVPRVQHYCLLLSTKHTHKASGYLVANKEKWNPASNVTHMQIQPHLSPILTYASSDQVKSGHLSLQPFRSDLLMSLIHTDHLWLGAKILRSLCSPNHIICFIQSYKMERS